MREGQIALLVVVIIGAIVFRAGWEFACSALDEEIERRKRDTDDTRRENFERLWGKNDTNKK